MEHKLDALLEKVSALESMMWEDRRFFVTMMVKVDKLIKSFNSFIFMDDVEEGFESKFSGEEIEKFLERLSEVREIEKEFRKYSKLMMSDQHGES